ncbi:hypothetical protein [Pantoea stewartii]|nr:hypothetical protein [Pantoea stewartii]
MTGSSPDQHESAVEKGIHSRNQHLIQAKKARLKNAAGHALLHAG